MPYTPSDTAKKLIALLNNAKELSIDHSNRILALDTINSCKILKNSRNFNISDDIFDSLIYAIKNYKPEGLLESLNKTEELIIAQDLSL